MALSDLLQGCSNKSDTVMHYMTRVLKGRQHKVVTILLYRIMIVTPLMEKKLVKSLVISTSLLQVVNNLFQTC